MSQPLVSIVVPFLDPGRFLHQAIASVEAQTYPHWELLLVDDGSTDGSTETARAWSERHPGAIRYFEHDDHRNLGPSASRNLGFHAAKGEYIATLDADDVWLPEKLERQIAVLQREPRASMVYGPSLDWFSWSDRPTRNDFVPTLGLDLDRLYLPPELLTLAYPLGRARTPCPSSLVFRREMLERTGGFEESFRGSFRLYEDIVFLVKVHLREPVFVMSECLDKYRQHAESAVSTLTGAGKYDEVRRYFLHWFAPYLGELGVDDPAIGRALERAWWPYRHQALHRQLGAARSLARRVLRLAHRLRRHREAPAVGRLRFGDLRRTTPLGRADDGQMRDLERHYVDEFIARHQADLRGVILHASVPRDLQALAPERYDAIVLPHVLHRLWEVDDAVRALHRGLKPGGVLLATAPGVTAAAVGDLDDDYWRFTESCLRARLETAFRPAEVSVESRGNVLAAVAALHGLSAGDLHRRELSHRDALYPLVIGARAVKARGRKT